MHERRNVLWFAVVVLTFLELWHSCRILLFCTCTITLIAYVCCLCKTLVKEFICQSKLLHPFLSFWNCQFLDAVLHIWVHYASFWNDNITQGYCHCWQIRVCKPNVKLCKENQTCTNVIYFVSQEDCVLCVVIAIIFLALNGWMHLTWNEIIVRQLQQGSFDSNMVWHRCVAITVVMLFIKRKEIGFVLLVHWNQCEKHWCPLQLSKGVVYEIMFLEGNVDNEDTLFIPACICNDGLVV
jgi:hypothetical protein